MEDLEVTHRLTGGGEHDRATGDLRHGQRRTTASVTVELGQHHSGEVHPLLECQCRVDRRLADHRVDDEQDLVGRDRLPDVRRLPHEVLVDCKATGCVDDDDVVLLGAGLHDTLSRDRDRVTERPRAVTGLGAGVIARDVATLWCEDRNTGALADDL